MQGLLLLAALLFQGLLIAHYTVTSLNSYAIYLPALLLVAANLACWYWGMGLGGNYADQAMRTYWLTSISICAAVIVLLLIRIHMLPRGFMGYWGRR
ncbi:hypothetical protein JW859_01270 [bacterium]|nr:hypothetical protein [bacterium]